LFLSGYEKENLPFSIYNKSLDDSDSHKVFELMNLVILEQVWLFLDMKTKENLPFTMRGNN
jgi:hypothetical protein